MAKPLREIVPLNELSKKTLSSYIKQRVYPLHREAEVGERYRHLPKKKLVPGEIDRGTEAFNNGQKYAKGIERAADRIGGSYDVKNPERYISGQRLQRYKTKRKYHVEETEPLNELSKNTLKSYLLHNMRRNKIYYHPEIAPNVKKPKEKKSVANSDPQYHHNFGQQQARQRIKAISRAEKRPSVTKGGGTPSYKPYKGIQGYHSAMAGDKYKDYSYAAQYGRRVYPVVKPTDTQRKTREIKGKKIKLADKWAPDESIHAFKKKLKAKEDAKQERQRLRADSKANLRGEETELNELSAKTLRSYKNKVLPRKNIEKSNYLALARKEKEQFPHPLSSRYMRKKWESSPIYNKITGRHIGVTQASDRLETIQAAGKYLNNPSNRKKWQEKGITAAKLKNLEPNYKIGKKGRDSLGFPTQDMGIDYRTKTKKSDKVKSAIMKTVKNKFDEKGRMSRGDLKILRLRTEL